MVATLLQLEVLVQACAQAQMAAKGLTQTLVHAPVQQGLPLLYCQHKVSTAILGS